MLVARQQAGRLAGYLLLRKAELVSCTRARLNAADAGGAPLRARIQITSGRLAGARSKFNGLRTASLGAGAGAGGPRWLRAFVSFAFLRLLAKRLFRRAEPGQADRKRARAYGAGSRRVASNAVRDFATGERDAERVTFARFRKYPDKPPPPPPPPPPLLRTGEPRRVGSPRVGRLRQARAESENTKRETLRPPGEELAAQNERTTDTRGENKLGVLVAQKVENENFGRAPEWGAERLSCISCFGRPGRSLLGVAAGGTGGRTSASASSPPPALGAIQLFKQAQACGAPTAGLSIHHRRDSARPANKRRTLVFAHLRASLPLTRPAGLAMVEANNWFFSTKWNNWDKPSECRPYNGKDCVHCCEYFGKAATVKRSAIGSLCYCESRKLRSEDNKPDDPIPKLGSLK
ncbi:Hypothetical predicted protein [Olea europaea subsp. europaea]|uniref:Uncharacterized protein n=1 Tax=Olea europaea subsp. europaea TaxID=158383 RepID=A0A8S0TKK8_OLEEU|nr:Hypothetical predicted protein [Olea europaea subsp. europaea]